MLFLFLTYRCIYYLIWCNNRCGCFCESVSTFYPCVFIIISFYDPTICVLLVVLCSENDSPDHSDTLPLLALHFTLYPHHLPLPFVLILTLTLTLSINLTLEWGKFSLWFMTYLPTSCWFYDLLFLLLHLLWCFFIIQYLIFSVVFFCNKPPCNDWYPDKVTKICKHEIKKVLVIVEDVVQGRNTS